MAGKLLACARETSAAVVGPLYYLGDPRDQIIHTAGAEMHIVETGNTRTLHERHRFGNQNANAVRSQLRREPIDLWNFIACSPGAT